MAKMLKSTLTRSLVAGAAMAVLAGCSSPAVSNHQTPETFSLAGLSTAIMTGTQAAIAAVTGNNCSLLENVLRNGRSFCETSDARVALIEKTPAAADLDPNILGFAPVDRRAAADFSLEIARRQNAAIDAPMLSFGMLSANYSPSFSYDLKLSDRAGNPTEPKLAEAAPVRATAPSLTTATSFTGY
ncbi:MAG: hypothetical protein Q7S99_12845 [Parvibaculum sp.]|nr:hypothetical protein [Parvibaculum sp.]